MMKCIDHHMHTNHSPDADPQATMQRYVIKAMERNHPGVMFTDHVDLETKVDLFKDYINYNSYQKEMDLLRLKYPIKMYMGIEMGYQAHIKNEMQAFLEKNAFDFVICSLHLGDLMDFYNGEFFIGKTQQKAYQRYFELVKEMVEQYDDYDVVGHIDYIIRYGDFQVKDYLYDDYKEIIDEILKAIIAKGKGIELNTSGLRYGLGVTHPKYELVQRYFELGGTIITLGSDAHQVKHMYDGFKDAIIRLKAIGFKSLTQFKNRKPYFIELNEDII